MEMNVFDVLVDYISWLEKVSPVLEWRNWFC